MKRPITVYGVILTAFNLYSEPKPNVEAIMYLDTEMPCLRDNEWLSGRIAIRNNGDTSIKLLKGTQAFPQMLVYEQLYLFPDLAAEGAGTVFIAPDSRLEGKPSRSSIKRGVDYYSQRNEDTMELKKGETLEITFIGREVDSPIFFSSGKRRDIPFKAELYLSPDTWIPVEVHPPIVVASGIAYTSVTPTEAGAKWDENATKVYRVPIGTNEVLLVKEKSKYHRLADLQPDDVVTHANKTITITQKNGNVRVIPEADIPRVSAERKEERRKKAETGK